MPPLEAFAAILEGTGEREISTTMAFVRILTALLKDKSIGKHIVPIVPDEARTFGMEGLFRQIGIYSSVGQLYTPAGCRDPDVLSRGQEGPDARGGHQRGRLALLVDRGRAPPTAITASAWCRSTSIYSMFGFQRVGDFIWAAGDIQARGFLLGATAGRTTLAGEGLQHQDGHSQLVATTVPNCVAYDPAYAYELAVIIQDGMRRMYVEQESIFYYITVMNENYPQPALPEGARGGHLKGGYLLRAARHGRSCARRCSAPAPSCASASRPRRCSRQTTACAPTCFSITSFSELRREALECERWNLLHPGRAGARALRAAVLKDAQGPIVAATDYMRTVPDQIRQWVPAPYVTLGTDGFGRSDARAALRRHFEVDRNYIAVAALKALADEGKHRAQRRDRRQ